MKKKKKHLPALLLLFVGSGCAALIYEVVWFQLLQLVIGSSAVSLGVLLGTFMGGMCLGSYMAPRCLDIRRHPLRLYAALELGIGAIGLLLLWAMPLVSGIYTAIGGGSIIVRSVIAGLCLLPPAMMMGATLPAIARWVETSPRGVSWLGFFYAGNLAGAVAGSLGAGFYLLRFYDVAVATCVAVALNVGVAAAALAVARRTAYVPATPVARPAAGRSPRSRVVYLAIGLSGLTALSSEVIWTRLLSLAFGATVYTFSLILAVFLVGLGIGSGIGSVLLRSRTRPRVALGWCQMLLCGAIGWAAYVLTGWLPYWPTAPAVQGDPWLTLQLDLFRSLLVVLPGAVLWGASFPLALSALAAPGQDPSRLVGGVYAANTIGAIAGSLGASLVLVTFLGSQRAQQTLIVISAISALALLAPVLARGRARRIGTVLLAAAAAGAVLVLLSVPAVPGVLVAYGRRSAEWVGLTNIVYAGEGLNAFVAVSRGSNGVLNYHAAGKVQASVQAEDMRLQRLLGHFSHLVPARPANVLVIGCGAGITAGAISIGPGVERLAIAEIEPLAVTAASTYFGDYNYQVIQSPKVTLHIDDGRHLLLTMNQKFDVITTDLIDPWVKGVATLFTREFFVAVRAHLNPGGVVTQFVQLYQSNREAVKSEIGTFMEVFPNAVVWGNPNEGRGYDLVLMGQVEPIRIDIDALQARLASPQYAEVAESLREIGIGSAVQLLSTYAGRAADLAPWLKDAVINRDRNLRLQYLAGMGLNLVQSGPIYAEMLRYARFPEDVFVGSAASVQALKESIDKARGR